MKKVIILFGGKSCEHEVSVNSALSIENNIDRKKYTTSVIGIAHNGSWHYGDTIASITSEGKVIPNGEHPLPTQEIITQLSKADVIFPIIHGTNGEDGTIQGFFEIGNIPYVGAGVLSSAICMDKVIQKQICSTVGIPQTDYTFFTKEDWTHNKDTIIEIITDQLSLPVFVKPANLGSSVGITKVKQKNELEPAIRNALQYDTKIIVEAGVSDIVEIEVSVLGNHTPQASVCGSIAPNTEFYDYETKYLTDDITATIPAQIEETDAQTIRDLAIETYQTLNCEGLARVDFFYKPTTHEVFLNEINTLPGFTRISMYPKLWEASGMNYQDVISKLIELGLESWQEKQNLKYTY